MARPLRITFPGAFYHVTSRGNEQKTVFKSKRDREKFLEYLQSATEGSCWGQVSTFDIICYLVYSASIGMLVPCQL